MTKTPVVYAGLVILLLFSVSAVAGAEQAEKKVERSPKLEKITLNVEGMTCALCARGIRSALLKVPGVKTAAVSLKKKTAVVEFEKDKVKTDQLIKAIEGAGYKASVAPEKAVLRIEGMTCSSCVLKVREALLKVPGVKSAEVGLQKNSAVVTIEKGKTTAVQLIEAVKKAGYRAFLQTEAQGKGGERKESD